MREILKSGSLEIKLNEILLWVLLFFGLFDTARNYTYLPIHFGYLKDISVYLLICLNIGRIRLHKNLGLGFYFWFLVVLFGTPFGFLYNPEKKIKILIACFKYIELFLLIIIFTNWDRLFNFDMNLFIRGYIYGSLLLCFVNVLGYFVDNPIVSRTLANSNMVLGFYEGRITVGQPAIAIFPVIISFVFLMATTIEKTTEKFLYVIFFACIILATSNTGLIAVVLCLCFIYIYVFCLTDDNRLKKRLALFLPACLAVLLTLQLIEKYTSVNVSSIYRERTGKYLTGSSDAMMDLRYTHLTEALTTMEPINCIFGKGAYGYLSGSAEIPIENTFRITYLMYGVVGIIAMTIFFMQWLLKIWQSPATEKHVRVFGLCLLIIYACHMYTLDLYLHYTLYFAFALFFSYTYKLNNVRQKSLNVSICNHSKNNN